MISSNYIALHRRGLLVAAVLTLALAGCSSNAITSKPTTVPAVSTGTSIPAPGLTPTQQASLTSSLTPTLADTLTPIPTATQTLRPECYEPVCIEVGHFLLARPVNGVLGDAIDPTYRYATSRSGLREVHTGVEMPAAHGDPVYAAAAGKVIVAGSDHDIQYGTWKDYYGNLVILLHIFEGYPPVYTLYAHLSEFNVQADQVVNPGEVIAWVGGTGAATGPHLHFEVRVGSIALGYTRNPELWLQPHVWAGLSGGAIAGLVTGPGGLPRKVESISIQPFASDGHPSGIAQYTQTYDPKMGHGDGLWKENFALGDLPVGRYQVAFVDLGKVRQQIVDVQPGSVTRLVFRVE